MTDALELKSILSDPAKDAEYFRSFSLALLSKYPELSGEELWSRWVELKKDAGLIDA